MRKLWVAEQDAEQKVRHFLGDLCCLVFQGEAIPDGDEGLWRELKSCDHLEDGDAVR